LHSDGDEPGDRRTEPRRPAKGEVTLRATDGVRPWVAGRLVDLSRSGFRVQHGSAALRAGEEVEFAVAGLPGRTRVAGKTVESGFLILAKDEA